MWHDHQDSLYATPTENMDSIDEDTQSSPGYLRGQASAEDQAIDGEDQAIDGDTQAIDEDSQSSPGHLRGQASDSD